MGNAVVCQVILLARSYRARNPIALKLTGPQNASARAPKQRASDDSVAHGSAVLGNVHTGCSASGTWTVAMFLHRQRSNQEVKGQNQSFLTEKQPVGCGKLLKKIPLPVPPTLPSSRLKTKSATANLFNSVHLFQRQMISFYVCNKNLSGIFCLLRNQTQGQAIAGYQRSDTGSRRKCWSHSTEERNRSLTGCAQTRSSFQ